MRRLGNTVTSVALAALVSGCGARTGLGLEETATGDVSAREVCNGKDDDGDGRVDDVHRAGGLKGCLRFGRLGAAGTKPSDRLEAFLVSNGASVERFLANGDILTSGALERFDVVIAESPTRAFSGVESHALGDWVEAGGGLFVTSGYRLDETDKSETNTIIAELGVKYEGDLLNGDVTQFGKHPTTTGLNRLPFLGGYQVSNVGADFGKFREVALLDGLPVGAVISHGKGRAFFWGDEWIEFDDEWTGQNDTPTFWLEVMRWLAHQS